jgi:hypothetical protein
MRLSVQATAMIVLIYGALWAGDAHAASAAGTWKSTSGNTFTIPDSKTDFDIICKTRAGQKMLLQGKWSKDKVGVQFTYGEGTVVCTFDSKNPDTLTCQQYDANTKKWNTTYWIREDK